MLLKKSPNVRISSGRPRTKKRLSKFDWLEASFDLLATRGHSALTIDELCKNLKVTKGSFYAHFKSRAEFSRRLIEFWEEQFTTRVSDAMQRLQDLPPEKRLFELLRYTTEHRSSQYDVPVRAWAATHPELHDVIEETDQLRLTTIRDILRQVGFRGRDLEMRTHAFVTYASFRWAVESPKFDAHTDENLRNVCRLFTSK